MSVCWYFTVKIKLVHHKAIFVKGLKCANIKNKVIFEFFKSNANDFEALLQYLFPEVLQKFGSARNPTKN